MASQPLSPDLAPAAPRGWRIPARAISPLVLLLAWELGSRTGLIPPRVLAAPTTVVATFVELLLSGELLSNLAVSLGRALTGLAIGGSIGIALGLVAGLSKRGEVAVDPPVQMLRTLPFLALVPLFIVWFGIGEVAKIALISLGVMFPVYLNLFNGIRGVDAKLVEAHAASACRNGGWCAM